MIKPGFFMDDELAECDPLARILFAGLWTLADREGRLEDRPTRIKAEVLPYDAVDVDELLCQLADRRFIVRYQVGGEGYVQVENFTKHQQPHYKEVPSTIPAPDGTPDAYVAVPVSENQRQRILARDGHKCVACGSGEDLSIDHILPRALGGDSSDGNLQVLCKYCNSSKGRRADFGPKLKRRRADVEATLPPDTDTDTDTDTEARARAPFDEFWSAWPNHHGSKKLTQDRFRKLSAVEQQHAIYAAGYVAEAMARGLLHPQFQPRSENFVGGQKRYFEEWRNGIPTRYTAGPPDKPPERSRTDQHYGPVEYQRCATCGELMLDCACDVFVPADAVVTA